MESSMESISTDQEESDVISNAGDNVKETLLANQSKPKIEDEMLKAIAVLSTSDNLNTVRDFLSIYLSFYFIFLFIDVIKDKNESDNPDDTGTASSGIIENIEIHTTDNSNSDKALPENNAEKVIASNFTSDTALPKNKGTKNIPSAVIECTETDTPDNLTTEKKTKRKKKKKGCKGSKKSTPLYSSPPKTPLTSDDYRTVPARKLNLPSYIINLIKQKNKALRRARRYPTPEYRLASNQLQRKVKQAVAGYRECLANEHMEK